MWLVDFILDIILDFILNFMQKAIENTEGFQEGSN